MKSGRPRKSTSGSSTLSPTARSFYTDWERNAKDLVAHLRWEAGGNPYDGGLSGLVGELSTRSTEFRTWWVAHNVRFHQTGTKHLQHPIVGEMELDYEVMEMSADSGLTMREAHRVILD
jgi:hypothetical protein